ncbi:diuretic hormone class 2-like [Uloborus diversus]|uniref:diuretic hormone class 2-like n=1 Tax=Uloborus diversus TaxID=327109 RepID=UPI00240A228F|nr:diuretic hormone class 2-like [Uloborus diversus]
MDSVLTFRVSIVILAFAVCFVSALDAQLQSRYRRSIVEIDDPKETLQVLGNLAQRIIEAETIQNEKRGLDLGLSRGFSGSQAAKHLMGLSAASFANGPGRKRRSMDQSQ